MKRFFRLYTEDNQGLKLYETQDKFGEISYTWDRVDAYIYNTEEHPNLPTSLEQDYITVEWLSEAEQMRRNHMPSLFPFIEIRPAQHGPRLSKTWRPRRQNKPQPFQNLLAQTDLIIGFQRV